MHRDAEPPRFLALEIRSSIKQICTGVRLAGGPDGTGQKSRWAPIAAFAPIRPGSLVAGP